MVKVHPGSFTGYNGLFVSACQNHWNLMVEPAYMGTLWGCTLTKVCNQNEFQGWNVFILGLKFCIMCNFLWYAYLGHWQGPLLMTWFSLIGKYWFTHLTNHQKSRLCTSGFWIFYIVWKIEDLCAVMPFSKKWGFGCFLSAVQVPFTQYQPFGFFHMR